MVHQINVPKSNCTLDSGVGLLATSFSAGGEDVAKEFRSQEIDGQALLLLTEDHLVSAMNLKLGPALKLYAHINSLKDS